jgi:hypothetical protein
LDDFASHNTRETLLALSCTKETGDFSSERRILLELLARRERGQNV